MSKSQQIIPMPSNKSLDWWDDEAKMKAFRNKFSKDLEISDLELFLIQCQRTRLDPFSNQIYAFKMGGRPVWMASIDGLRVLAERTGRYAPGKETSFQYDEKKNLVSATAYVKKLTSDGTWHEVAVTAFMSEYDKGSGCWKDKKHVMLSKSAEAQALRRAFPNDLSGLYVKEEMEKEEMEKEEIDNDMPEITIEAKEEPPKMTDFISEEQCSEIEELMEKCSPTLRNRIFDRYQTKQVKNIPAKSYGIVKQAILKEIEEKKKVECEVTQVAFDAFQKREVAHA